MAAADTSKLEQLPEEMFTIIRAAASGLGPRLGRLTIPGRHSIETPHYLGITSRGVIPHMTQDTFARDTSISGVYVGLEDFIERAPYQTPPLYKFKPPDGSSPLRRFIALPDDTLCVLGARRTPPVAAPAANPNTDETVSVCTAVGFRVLNADEYAEAVEELRADIVIGLGDIPYGRSLGNKRIEKGTDRMIKWMSEHVQLQKDRTEAGHGEQQAKLFAPLMPVSCANQQFYIDCLTNDVKDDVSGLALYDMRTLQDLPHALQHLSRLGFVTPATPQNVLRDIALGIDIHTIPFTSAATDAGIALDFSFPPSSAAVLDHKSQGPRPLGIDMWSTSHATDLSPLVENCKCYACTNHHRAYVQHLLAAKEMLGWVLLQIHNHHIIDLFFAGVRKAIAGGTFEHEVENFAKAYESSLPEKTGQGPRVRGYQFKSEGPGEAKKNKAAFNTLDQIKRSVDATPPNAATGATNQMLDEGKQVLAEAALPNKEADTDDLQVQGFAERQ